MNPVSLQSKRTQPMLPIGPGSSPDVVWPFYVVLAALVFEFGRPQYVIPGLKLVPIASILDVLIAVAILATGRFALGNTQTKLWVPLLLAMVIHVPFAVNNFHALITLKAMALTFVLYLGIITYVNSVQRIRTLMTVWLAIHVLLAPLGILSGGRGIGGWLEDENDFCMALVMVLPFAFFMMETSPAGKDRLRNMAFLVLFIATIGTTLSRGGFIGMIAAGLYSWSRSSRKMGAVVVVVILALFMALLAPAEYWGEIGSSFTEETMEKGTGGDRLYIWGIGVEMFLANPILGVGQGNFPWTFEEYEAGRTFDERSRAGRAAHSLYFTLLPEMGLFGIVIFASMLWFTRQDVRLVRSRLSGPSNQGVAREPESEADRVFLLAMLSAMEASLVGFLVSSIFISTLWYPSFWVMVGFVVALRNTILSVPDVRGGSLAKGAGHRSPLLRMRPLSPKRA